MNTLVSIAVIMVTNIGLANGGHTVFATVEAPKSGQSSWVVQYAVMAIDRKDDAAGVTGKALVKCFATRPRRVYEGVDTQAGRIAPSIDGHRVGFYHVETASDKPVVCVLTAKPADHGRIGLGVVCETPMVSPQIRLTYRITAVAPRKGPVLVP